MSTAEERAREVAAAATAQATARRSLERAKQHQFEAQPPPSGMIRLVAATGSTVTVIRNGDIDRGGGVGGWQTSERYLREDADWWKATTKPTVSIPCMIDLHEIHGGGSVEKRLATLYGMGHAGDEDQPPGIRLLGDAPRCKRITWKIDDITLGASVYRHDSPRKLLRQELTISLSKLMIADGIEPVTLKRSRTASGARRSRTVHAHHGDTMRGIAVRELGSSNQWRDIRDWNPKLKKTDPDAKLRAGTKVVLK